MKLTTRSPIRTWLAVASTTAVVGTLLVAAPANAAGLATPQRSVALTSEDLHGLGRALDMRTGVFDGAVARDAGVANDFATGWSAAGNPVHHAAVDSARVDDVRAAVADLRGCAGRNRWDYTGIQLNVHLSSCNTTRVIGLINTGSGVAAIAAAVTAVTGLGVAVAGAFAGVLTVAGGVLTTCSAKGRGIVVHNIPPGPVVWCGGQ